MKDKDIKIVLPFMGELGSKLSKHVPGVHGIPRPLVICHEAGEEAIYPNATERYIYERHAANQRSAGGNRYQVRFKDSGKLKWPVGKIPYMDEIKAHFEPQVWEDHIKTDKPLQWQRTYIEPTAPFKMPPSFFIPQHIGTYDYDFDVLLFARRQNYANGRNWQRWDEFYAALKAEGIKCLVAGHPDSTADLGCKAVWDLVDNETQILDATIWAIQNARFRIGTPTGTTLLSQMCGKPCIMIIGDMGMDASGSKMTFPAGYYYKVDHTHVGWACIAHWMRWERVIEEFLDIYADQEKFEIECKTWVKAIHEKLKMPDPDRLWRQIK